MPSTFIAACSASFMLIAGLVADGFAASAAGDTSCRSYILVARAKRLVSSVDSFVSDWRSPLSEMWLGSESRSSSETPRRSESVSLAVAYASCSDSIRRATSVDMGVMATTGATPSLMSFSAISSRGARSTVRWVTA